MTMTPDMLQGGSSNFGNLAAGSNKNASPAGGAQASAATIAAAVVGAAIGVALLSVGGVIWIRRQRCSIRTIPEDAQEAMEQQQQQDPSAAAAVNKSSETALAEKEI
jgi:hypothetical protein